MIPTKFGKKNEFHWWIFILIRRQILIQHLSPSPTALGAEQNAGAGNLLDNLELGTLVKLYFDTLIKELFGLHEDIKNI